MLNIPPPLAMRWIWLKIPVQTFKQCSFDLSTSFLISFLYFQSTPVSSCCIKSKFPHYQIKSFDFTNVNWIWTWTLFCVMYSCGWWWWSSWPQNSTEDKNENGKFKHLFADTSVSPLGLFNTLTINITFTWIFKEQN